MDAMVRDMRNRFLVALVFTVPTVIWSEVGTTLLGGEVATPFGIEHDIWLLLLRLPYGFYVASLVGGALFHVIMVFRGHLFGELDGSTHRQRMFRHRNA